MARGKHRRPEPNYGQLVAPQIAYPAPPPFFGPAPGPGLTIQVLGAKNATVAKVQLTKPTEDWSGQQYRFEVAESAKREQGDVFDPETGEKLALARAFQRLSRDLFSDAAQRVRDSVAEQERQEAERERRREAARKPVKRRTREEWEAMQRARLVPQEFEQDLKTYAQQAEFVSRYLHKHDAESVRQLRAKRDEINTALQILGDPEA
jgi:hypothetical protein